MSTTSNSASSWFANGSSALTSGLSLVSKVVSDVAAAVDGDDDGSGSGSDTREGLRGGQGSWKDELAEKDRQIAHLTAKLEASNEAALEAKNAALQDKLAKAVAHLRPLADEVKTLKAKLASSDSSQQQHVDQQQLIKLQSENSSLSESLSQAETEITALHLQLQSEARVWEQKVRALEQQLVQQKEEAIKANNSDALELELATTKQQLESLHEQHSATQTSLTQSQEKVAKLQSKLRQTLEANKKLQAKSPISSPVPPSASLDLSAEISALQSQLATQSASHEKELESLKEDIEFYKSEVESLQSTTSTLTQSLKEARDKSLLLEASLRETTESKEVLQQQLENLQTQDPSQLGDDLEKETMKQDLDALHTQLTDLKHKNHHLSSKLEQTQEVTSELESQVADLSAQLSEATTQLDSVTAQLEQYSTENNLLTTKITTLTTENESYISQITTLTTETQSLTTDLTTTKTALATLTATTESLTADLTETKTALTTLQTEYKSYVDSTSDSHHPPPTDHQHQHPQDFETRLSESLLHLETTHSIRVTDLEYQLTDLRAQVEELQAQLSHAHKIVASEKAGVDAVRGEMEVFGEQVLEGLGILGRVLEGGGEGEGVDGFGALPVSVKAAFNRVLEEVRNGAGGGRAGVEAVTLEYEQVMVDLNAELEEKSRVVRELEETVKVIGAEREKAVADHARLMDKLKNTVAPKLQEEMDANKSLRAHVDSLTTQIANLTDEKQLLKTEIADLTAAVSAAQQQAAISEMPSNNTSSTDDNINSQSSLQDLESQLEALRTENETLHRKLTTLQHHLAESEEAFTQDLVKTQSLVDEYRVQVETLERERETWEVMASEATNAVRIAEENSVEAQRELMEARAGLEEAVRGRERDLISLGNLQAVLEEFQASKQAEIDLAIETMSKQLATATSSLQEYRARAEQAESQLASVSETIASTSTTTDLTNQLAERTAEVGKLRGRIISLETYLSEAIRRAASADNQVDRRLISNLVVQFLGAPRGDSKRFEMLTVIASVLKLSDEEKVKVGLMRKVGGGGGGGGDGKQRVGVAGAVGGAAGETFTDLWISFLIKEAGAGDAAAAAAAAAAGRSLDGSMTPLRRDSVSGDVVSPGAEGGVMSPTAPKPPTRTGSALGFLAGWRGGDKKE
ncbi:hypothetical protein HDU79_007853 [Rhizoclosmatium sp. JEL0117]|nr:hypothetical protein HDU79_007853 [Rhizoclosmatium sp. JEL0117]